MTKSERTANGWWWLRSPGNSQRTAALVCSHGDIVTFGIYVNYELGVRPALNLKF